MSRFNASPFYSILSLDRIFVGIEYKNVKIYDKVPCLRHEDRVLGCCADSTLSDIP